MLSSRKTIESRGLQASMKKTISLSQSRTAHRPSSSLLSCRREFSWVSKHKNTTSCAGKVYKGFDTGDFAAKDRTRKQLFRSAFWGDNHFHQYIIRYGPIQEWRYSSSWGKKPETFSRSRAQADPNEAENWYTRWEKQKMTQYEEFMKKVEDDPYTALFGRNWLDLRGESTKPEDTTTLSSKSPKETSTPMHQKTSNIPPSILKSSSTKTTENSDILRRQPRNGPIPVQEHGQEYEIDPITNRKVPKRSASPLPTGGHVEPQIKDKEKASGGLNIRWNLASPTPSDRHSIKIEHAQALSASHQPSKDSPFLKSHNGAEWLAGEGSGSFQESKDDGLPTHRTHDAKSTTTAAKIESALDRHLSSKRTEKCEKKDRPQYHYKLEENKIEDVDLLRPSDVRASAGLRGKSPRKTEIDKQARRLELEEKYESCPLRLDGEATSSRLMQKREDHPVEAGTAEELRSGSWLKGTMQDARVRNIEASKAASATRVNDSSDSKEFDPVPGDQTPNYTSGSKSGIFSEALNAVVPKAQAHTNSKANKLKAQIVPFKAKLDAMKTDYDFLREQWLQEIRRVKEIAAKKESEKALKFANRAREIHEDEIKAQKIAMEAVEMHSSNWRTDSTKTVLAQSVQNDDEKPAPRRLQSFLQGEGDMASNVHEFAGRDRWYKRKAPHAMDAKDVEMDAKLRKLAADRDLIREVRGIYEDTYGTIDTKHHQPEIPSVLLTKHSGQLMTSSTETVPTQAQLPSSAASRIESSRGLNQSQVSRALEIVQKLFGQLREAQSVIQDYRCQSEHATGLSGQNANMFRPPGAFEKSVMQIVKTLEQLSRVKSGGTTDQGFVEAIDAANSKEPAINSPLPTTAPESTNVEVQKPTKRNTLSAPAHDLATKKMDAAAVATPAPSSKEESLLSLEALIRSSIPGKLLQTMPSGVELYEIGSGTRKISMFMREATPEELAEIKKLDTRKVQNSSRTPLDPLSLIPDDVSFIYWGGRWQTLVPLKSREPQKHVVEKTENNDQQVKDAIETGMDGVKKKQPHPVLTASPNGRSHEKVHGQETLFSGSRNGGWVDKGVRTAMNSTKKKQQPFQSGLPAPQSDRFKKKVHRQETLFSGSRRFELADKGLRTEKKKRARRRKTMKRMLMAGAFTAACCYCVGVASERMQKG